MTVKELILKLLELDPGLEVLVQGYEGGYSKADIGEPRTFLENYNSGDYCGPHEDYIPSSDVSLYRSFRGVVIYDDERSRY